MYKNKVWVDKRANLIDFTFRAWQKWGPIWKTFGHLKDDRNSKQKIGKAEPLANINFRQKTKKRHRLTSNSSCAGAPRRSSKTTPAHGKRKICSSIKWNTVFINRYECEPVFEQNHATELGCMEKTDSGIPRDPRLSSKKPTGCIQFWMTVLRTFLIVIIKGREHRCGNLSRAGENNVFWNFCTRVRFYLPQGLAEDCEW